jgi:hypothetical protein
VTSVQSQARPGAAIAAFAFSAAMLATPSPAAATEGNDSHAPLSGYVATRSPAPIDIAPLRPAAVASPTATFTGFAHTTGSAPACIPGGTHTSPPPTATSTSSSAVTPSPSVTPTVLGVTFVTPSPSPPAATKPGGRLPFTGLPLVQSLTTGIGLVAAGVALRYSRRRHRQSATTSPNP